MVVPSTDGSPSRYQPNPIDDRAVTGWASSVYLALASAIEEVENIRQARFPLDPGTRRGINTAESALRRAAFSLVVHAEHNPQE